MESCIVFILVLCIFRFHRLSRIMLINNNALKMLICSSKFYSLFGFKLDNKNAWSSLFWLFKCYRALRWPLVNHDAWLLNTVERKKKTVSFDLDNDSKILSHSEKSLRAQTDQSLAHLRVLAHFYIIIQSKRQIFQYFQKRQWQKNTGRSIYVSIASCFSISAHWTIHR